MKIYIIGSVGSGKTTLAKEIAEKRGVPRFETDNFVWERHKGGDLRNSVEKRNSQFQEAVRLREWVIEGVHIGWTDDGLQRADLIVFLDVPPKVRTRRIIKRFMKQKLRLESANYRQTLRIFYKMFGWNRYFEETMKPEFLQKLEQYPEKTIIVKNQKELEVLMEVKQWNSVSMHL